MQLIIKVAISLLVTVAFIGGVLFVGVQQLEKRQQDLDTAARSIKKEDIAVTFPEGRRREEMAALLEEAGICSRNDFLAASTKDEGYLFPDTYRFFPNTPASEVVATLKKTFAAKTASYNVTHDQLIVASIVEREAKTDEERPLIAGVYNNRLSIGMKLDADPTVQYSKDTAAFMAQNQPSIFDFWKPITQSDYTSVVSPYNTYRATGLPPSPIANPGLKSIAAAMAPAQHDYYFFLHKDGQLLLSKTLAEHSSKF